MYTSTNVIRVEYFHAVLFTAQYQSFYSTIQIDVLYSENQCGEKILLHSIDCNVE